MNIKNVWLIAMLAVIGAVALWGCNPPAEEPTDTPAPSDSTSTATPEQPAPDPGVGDSTAEPVAFTNDKGQIICPVMGSVIEDKSKAVGYQDHEGMRYYFCCESCPPAFKENPDKYTKKESAEGSGDAAGGSGDTGA